ncbi:MAG: chemotaxis protein CheW [Deltaproteobacteria bacterium]|nr:chemotaxis protein CheW [Deltaproteobacteria bacterium]
MAQLALLNENILQLASFRLADRLFGVNILDVREITREMEFTPVFHSPPEVKGYVNIRGKVYLILDLRTMLGFPPGEPSSMSRLVIFKPEVGESFGVLVDQVGDIINAPADSVEYRAEFNEGQALQGEPHKNLILGECKLNNQLVIMLNPVNFLKVLE